MTFLSCEIPAGRNSRRAAAGSGARWDRIGRDPGRLDFSKQLEPPMHADGPERVGSRERTVGRADGSGEPIVGTDAAVGTEPSVCIGGSIFLMPRRAGAAPDGARWAYTRP